MQHLLLLARKYHSTIGKKVGDVNFFKKLLGMKSKSEYIQMIQNGAMLVDVRSIDEFRSGHNKGARNIPLAVLPTQLSELKGKTVILVCLSGGRAGLAKQLLKQHGIESHNAGGWKSLE